MVIFVLGLPGTGKTFFAEALAQQLEAIHINSDKTRAVLHKMGQYDQSSRMMVYNNMLQQLKTALNNEENVILDATFYSKEIRNIFFNVIFDYTHAPLMIVRTSAAEETIKNRTSQKRKDSEADYSVYLNLKDSFEPIEEPHIELFSDQMTLKEMLGYTKKHFNI